MQKSGLVRSSSPMVMAIGFAKFLGIVSIVPINQLLGNVGQGFYATAYNLFTIVLVLAHSGFPNALAKLISERVSLENYEEIESLYGQTLKVVGVLGMIGALVMWFGAPYYASLVALHANKKDISEMTLSIRALAPAMLIVPIESALRGYLQGFQKVRGPAISQAVEQFFRVIVAVFGALIIIKAGKGVAAGAAAATFGAFAGAVAGVIVLWISVLPIRRSSRQSLSPLRATTPNLKRLLLSVALPIGLGSLVVPISSNVDSFTVVNLLTHFAGQTFAQAQAGFGILSRQAQNLVQLPLAFALAVGFSVMPAVSAAKSSNNQPAIKAHIIASIRMMFFVTFPAAAVFLTLARPIEYILSSSYKGSGIIATISFMCIFSSVELISTYILQGLGNLYTPVRNMFYGIALKALLNIVLILLLKSVIGAAVATITGYMLSSTLNIRAVRKVSGVRFSVLRLAVPFFLATIPVIAEVLIVNYLLSSLGYLVLHQTTWAWVVLQFIISGSSGGALYVFIALRTQIIRPEQVRSLPFIGRWLSRRSLSY